MKILVDENEHCIHLRVPTGLILNRVTALAFPGMLKKHGISITYRQAAVFLKALNQYRRSHRD